MKTRVIPASDPKAILHAVDVLKQHGIVAFPTDTVYGLGAGVRDPIGVDRLYSVKGRDHTKAIAVLLSDPDQLSEVALELPGKADKIARAYWPGPLTLIVLRHPDVPGIVSPTPTLGVRIPDHPVALKLMNKTGPLAVTSANLSGANNAVTAGEVLEQLDGRIDLILDGGKTPGGVPSTVLDCTTDKLKILREGPIGLKEIERFLQEA